MPSANLTGIARRVALMVACILPCLPVAVLADEAAARAVNFPVCASTMGTYVMDVTVPTISGLFWRTRAGCEHEGAYKPTPDKVTVDAADHLVRHAAAFYRPWRSCDGGAHWQICKGCKKAEAECRVADINNLTIADSVED